MNDEVIPAIAASARRASSAQVGRLFAATAQRVPQHCAIACGQVHLTYAELNQRVNRLANALRQFGIRRGQRIALLARNCSQYLEVELAAAKLGVITAALNWRLAEQELRHCVQLVSPTLLVAQPEYAPPSSAPEPAHAAAHAI